MASLLRNFAGTVIGSTPLLLAFSTAPTFSILWTGVRALTLPFPVSVYEKCDEYLYHIYQSFVSFFYEHWAGVRIVFHGDLLPSSAPNVTIVPLTENGNEPVSQINTNNNNNTSTSASTSTSISTPTTDNAQLPPLFADPENVLYFSNHQCAADWIVVDFVALRNAALGRIRYIMKRSLRFLPLYGWYFAMHNCVFVQKNWAQDQLRLKYSLDLFQKRSIPLWLVIFPEGTRFNPKEKADVLEKSRAYCREHNWPEFDQVKAHVLTMRKRIE